MTEGAVVKRYPPLVATLDLPVHADAAPRAHRALHDVFVARDIRDEDWIYHALLVVSELVSNAFRHGGHRIHLEAAYRDHLRISVADGSSVVPVMRDGDDADESGRGLAIIEALTTKREVENLPGGGKRVSAELRPPKWPGGRL